jgi:hypothetical protein
MDSINFEFFIENDSNPFILFSNTGKIKYLNSSAEILMGSCSSKEIFDLTLTYAPKTFGFKKSAISLSFSSFQFYGINVLYENDDFIAIHLYNKGIEKIDKLMVLDGFTSTDMNMLLQANIELFDINYTGKISLLTDYDIPEFQVHQNNFSLLLGKLFSEFNESKNLAISVKIKLGERVVLKEKRYAIIVLTLKSNKRKNEKERELKNLANKNCINIQFQKNLITLEVPAII